jgi:hypothetical protein
MPLSPMPSLHELQQAVRRSLIGTDDRAALPYIVTDGLRPQQRLDVYRNTFGSNLANALHLSFPAVHKLVGAEFFEGAARIFAREHPPRASWLDEFGADFADFLAAFAPAASLAYLADVARLEWAVNRALHAQDSDPVDVTALAGVDPVWHERVCLVADPSISLLRTDHPADTIWRAVLGGDDAALAAIDPADGPVWLLVQRHASGIEVTRLDEPSWRISTALFGGQRLGTALNSTDLATAAAVLAGHLAAGRIVAFSLAQSTSDDDGFSRIDA